MKKLWMGAFAGFTLLALAPNAWATSWLNNFFNGPDPLCVIACLSEVALDSRGECKPKDRLECQLGCNTAPKVVQVIAGETLDLDQLARDYPEKWGNEIIQRVEAYQRVLGLDPTKTELVGYTNVNNPLALLGIRSPQLDTFLFPFPLGQGDSPCEGDENCNDEDEPTDNDCKCHVMAANWKCTFSRTQPLPAGAGFGLGCRETPREATAGASLPPGVVPWGDQGCSASVGCCNVRSNPADASTFGKGTCTVNSTLAGDALY